MRTPHGTVRARWVVRATEGYTAALPGLQRELLPLSSSMIVTEPLDAEIWAKIGWQGSEPLDDAAHAYIYAQRTADGRIAIGGRGRPIASARASTAAADPRATVRQLRARLIRLFPMLAACASTAPGRASSASRATGPPRCTAIATSGLCWAGGYAGEGVDAANLAARTLRDLVLDRDTELAHLPWVGHHARDWEPEPLRWLAVQTVYGAFRTADAIEDRTGKPSWLAGAAGAWPGAEQHHRGKGVPPPATPDGAGARTAPSYCRKPRAIPRSSRRGRRHQCCPADQRLWWGRLASAAGRCVADGSAVPTLPSRYSQM